MKYLTIILILFTLTGTAQYETDTTYKVIHEGQTIYVPYETAIAIINLDSLVYGVYYFYDSLITIELTEDVWGDVTNGDSMFIIQESRNIAYLPGDTFEFEENGIFRVATFLVAYSSAVTSSCKFQYLIDGSGYYVGYNFLSTAPIGIEFELTRRFTAGEKLIIQTMNITNNYDVIITDCRTSITKQSKN